MARDPNSGKDQNNEIDQFFGQFEEMGGDESRANSSAKQITANRGARHRRSPGSGSDVPDPGKERGSASLQAAKAGAPEKNSSREQKASRETSSGSDYDEAIQIPSAKKERRTRAESALIPGMAAEAAAAGGMMTAGAGPSLRRGGDGVRASGDVRTSRNPSGAGAGRKTGEAGRPSTAAASSGRSAVAAQKPAAGQRSGSGVRPSGQGQRPGGTGEKSAPGQRAGQRPSGTGQRMPDERRAGDGRTQGQRSADVPGRQGSPAKTGQRSGTPANPEQSRSGTPSRPGQPRAGAPSKSGQSRSGTPSKSGQPRSGAPSKPGQSRSGAPSRPGQPRTQAAGRPGQRTGGSSRRGGFSDPPGRSGRGTDPRKKPDRKLKKKKHIAFRIFNFAILSCLIGGFVIGGIVVLYVYNVVKDIEQYSPDQIEQKLYQSSTLYDDKGKEIKEVFMGDQMRILVKYEQLPKNLKNAFVSIEDKTFWDHHGFNFTRIAGAIYESLTGGGGIRGTSTLTQQLARNVWLEDERDVRTMDRKIKEAYYAILLERNLKKEQILNYYLNTIAFGNRSYGVEAASQNYFNKHVEDLDLVECAALASLPKSPSRYSMIITVEKGVVSSDDPRLLKTGREYDYLYNDELENSGRIKLVLKSMLDQQLITKAEHDEAAAADLRNHVKPTEAVSNEQASFFVDYTIQNVAKDLSKKLDIPYDDALQRVYIGGYNIYTTIDLKMQNIILEEYKDSSNFPQVRNLRRDDNGNLLNEQRQIMLYKRSNLFDDKNVFAFKSDEYEKKSDGSLLIKKNKRLNLYRTSVQEKEDVSIEFKDIYHYDKNDKINIIKGGVINIPQQYKTMDEDGNCIISAAFFTENPKLVDMSGKHPSIPPASYTLRQSIIQPQSAMVIVDHTNGQLKAMVGGRNITGHMNYNRAINPRQPGSSVKPLGVYGPAIQSGANKEPVGDSYQENSFGKYWTALSIIVDEPIKVGGKVWPKNSYAGYTGPQTLRRSMEQSINVNAVKIQRNLGTSKSIAFMKRLGITSLVEDKNKANDLNPAALALGGMTKGISPLEMAAAYGAFANKGVYVRPIAYSKVETKEGDLVLDGKSEKKQAMDAGTAFIVNDIMRGVVTRGTGTRASISGIPVAGKTGTTSDNCDVWFVGNTPKYSAAIWIGNDVKLELDQTSRAASALWGQIMRQTMREVSQPDSFPDRPDSVIRGSVGGYSDYFVKGTVPSRISSSYSTKSVSICQDSGLLATPWCPNTKSKKFGSLMDGDGGDEKAPSKYCYLHNTNPDKYPVPGGKEVDPNFDPDDPTGEKKEQEKEEDTKKEEDKKNENKKPPKKPEKPITEITPEPTPEPEPTPVEPPPVSGAGIRSVALAAATVHDVRRSSYRSFFLYYPGMKMAG